MRLAWKRGLLKYKLQAHQHDLYDIFESTTHRITVVNASRRWGKTAVAIIYGINFGMQNTGVEIKMTSKTQSGMRDAFIPIWNMICRDAPKGYAPKWSTKDGCYVFPNGSRFHIHGTDNKRYENLRGDRCDLGIVDEAAFCADLRYIVLNVLLPQTITCGGKIIMMSTPDPRGSKSGEEFHEFCKQADIRGAYFKRDIFSNTSITQEEINEFIENYGGEESVEWQTEFLVKFVIDPEKSIVPEWDTDLYVLPEYFDPVDQFYRFYHKYTCLDLGVKRDFTVGLSAYYNFADATLYVMNEFAIKNTTTPKIAEMLKICELEVFGDLPIYRRICDSDNPQLVNDFVHLHHIGISAVEKTTLEAMVNTMRMLVGGGQVKIHPRCKQLIKTLEYGVWSNSEAGKLKKDFGRTVELGHMDALAALMYLIRSLNRTSNPVPITHGINVANTLMQNHNQDTHNKSQFRNGFISSANRRKKN